MPDFVPASPFKTKEGLRNAEPLLLQELLDPSAFGVRMTLVLRASLHQFFSVEGDEQFFVC
ncbi:hypothetical protein, partial [Fibrobacter sp.]|uniref:hypothetical protein n=1 Tax=Fibrobacter sp. TaxID=35828 RepID=UPI0025BAF150